MGFIQAFMGAAGSSLGDQWKDVIVPADAPATAGVIPSVMKGTNAGRGSNTHGSEGVITNGSKIMVPDSYALVTMQDNMMDRFIGIPRFIACRLLTNFFIISETILKFNTICPEHQGF